MRIQAEGSRAARRRRSTWPGSIGRCCHRRQRHWVSAVDRSRKCHAASRLKSHQHSANRCTSACSRSGASSPCMSARFFFFYKCYRQVYLSWEPRSFRVEYVCDAISNSRTAERCLFDRENEEGEVKRKWIRFWS